MPRWLETREDVIYLIAEDGNRYAFQPRITRPDSGHILVKDKFGKRRGVSGDRVGDKFVTNPLCKNARALLSQEEIDEAKGLEKLFPEPLANQLSPPELRTKPKSPIMGMSNEEVKAYLDSKYGSPPPD